MHDRALCPEDEGFFPEPTAADLAALERLGERRRALEAAAPADHQDAARRRHQLAILDEMEEAMCLHGHDDPQVAECRERLAACAAFGGNGQPEEETQ